MGPLAEFIIEEQLDSDDLHIRNDLFPQRNEHDDNDVQYIGHNSIEDFVDRIESDYHEKKKYNDESRKYAALRILSQMRDQYPNFIFSAPEFTNTRDGSITEIDDINSVKAKELLMGLLHLREQLQNQIQEQVQEKMQQANQEKTKEQLRSEALLQIRLVALSYKETPDRDQHNLFYYGGSDKDRSHEAWRLMQLMANRRTALENVLKGIPVAEGDDRHRIGDLSENALAEIRRVNMNLENKILQDYGMRFRQEPRNSQQPSEIEAHTTAYYHFLSDYLKRAQNWNIDQRYMPESAAYEVVEDWEDQDLQRLPSVEINVPAYNDASKNDLERVPHLNAAEFIRHTGEFKYPYYLADSTFIYSNEAVNYSALEIIRELEGKGITINSPYYSIRPSENRNVGGENQSIHPIESVDDINSFRADYFLAYLLEIQEEVNRSEKKKKDLSELVGPVLTIGHNRRDNQWADGSRIHPYGLQEVDGIVTDWIARRAALGNTLDSADPTNNAYRLGAMTEKENALLKQKIAQLEALIGERLKVIPRLSQNLLDEISGTPQEEDILLRHYDFLTRFKNSRTWLWGRNRVFKHFLTKEIEVDGQTHTVYQHAPLSTVDTFVLEFDDTDHLHIPLRHSGTLADKFEEIMRRVVAAEELQKEQSETARNPADSDH